MAGGKIGSVCYWELLKNHIAKGVDMRRREELEQKFCEVFRFFFNFKIDVKLVTVS